MLALCTSKAADMPCRQHHTRSNYHEVNAIVTPYPVWTHTLMSERSHLRWHRETIAVPLSHGKLCLNRSSSAISAPARRSRIVPFAGRDAISNAGHRARRKTPNLGPSETKPQLILATGSSMRSGLRAWRSRFASRSSQVPKTAGSGSTGYMVEVYWERVTNLLIR